MEWIGIALLLFVGAGIVGTGLPAVIVLISAAMLGIVIGVVSGTFPLSIAGALPARIINLLEYDLLQALPLYVCMGLLLDRLPIADALYRTSIAVLPRKPSAPLVSGILLGGLLGPMNGSVGASVLGLSRAIAPRLADAGVPTATRYAIVAVSSTLGVLVPPSLVLILLGDAMLSAHTIAVTTTGRNDRVLNTQDVFHGALVPAGLFLLACVIIAWFSGRKLPPVSAPREKLRPQQAILALFSLAALIALLGGVAAGYFYAVEAAAMGAFTLLAAGLITGRLRGEALRALLKDALATTGALFSLLVAATTLTLVLRLFGTDQLVNRAIAAIPGNDVTSVAIVLATIGLCAFVLDAFEIIFVIVPIVIPALLIRVADARWVAVLVLFTLQTSFLLPPFGYALMMVRGTLKDRVDFRPFMRALAPFLFAQWLLLLTILFVPALVHIGEKAGSASRASPLSEEEINKRLNEIAIPLPDFEEK